MSSLSAMILAGGRSHRMGTDKALLNLPNGLPLIKRTAQIAQTLAFEVFVVTPWPERYAPLLPLDVQQIKEQPHQSGPLGGFSQGWRHIRSEWCLLLACDLPQLERKPLCEWWNWLQKQPAAKAASRKKADKQGVNGQGVNELGGHSSVVASLTQRKSGKRNHLENHSEKCWEPLCGFYHKSCVQSLHRHLNATSDEHNPRHFSFQAWLETLSVLTYDKVPSSLLFNCNTAKDWSQLVASSASTSSVRSSSDVSPTSGAPK